MTTKCLSIAILSLDPEVSSAQPRLLFWYFPRFVFLYLHLRLTIVLTSLYYWSDGGFVNCA